MNPKQVQKTAQFGQQNSNLKIICIKKLVAFKIPDHILCDKCGELLTNTIEFRNHNKKYHFSQKKQIATQNFEKNKITKYYLCDKDLLQNNDQNHEFACECGEIFESKNQLHLHKSSHNSTPKSCPECSETYMTVGSLTRHIRRVHDRKYIPDKTRLQENMKCPICNQIYFKNTIKSHIKTHSEKMFSCSVCDKKFSTKYNMKLHLQTHCTTKLYKCSICEKSFSRKQYYMYHMNKHNNIKPFSCKYCGAKFSRRNNCTRHVRKHENNKKFTCDICGKIFKREFNFNKHLLSHSKKASYCCDICGKQLSRGSTFRKHLKHCSSTEKK